MKKILFIGGYPNEEEPVRNVFFQKLVWEMANQGIKCTVIAPVPVRKMTSLRIDDTSIERTSKGATINVLRPKYISFSSKSIGKLNTIIFSEASFRRAVKRTAFKLDMEFDAIYGHFILRGGIAAAEIGERYNIPSFFACGESDIYKDTFDRYPIEKAKMVKKCKGVISVSSKNKKDLIDIGLISASDILVAPNAVDTSLFHAGDKREARRKLGFPENETIVGFAGYFINRKGDKRVLEAANGLPVKLAFAGRGDNPPKGDNVVFAGSLAHEQMPLFYQACDMFVLPTLAEGCCNSIVEAMACGLPIVSSDLPFNDDILDEANSIRIAPNDVQEIRNAIKTLIDDPELMKSMSIASIESAKDWTIGKRVENILQFMDYKVSEMRTWK